MSEFVNIKQLVKNTTHDNKILTYQIQSSKDNDYIETKFVGKYDEIPIVPMYKTQIDKYECQLVGFIISVEEIKTDKYLKMIGYLIFDKDKIMASLEYVFEKKNIIDLKNKNYGKFHIILNTTKKKDIIIKSFDRFSGNEESVYILSAVLADDHIIEQI